MIGSQIIKTFLGTNKPKDLYRIVITYIYPINHVSSKSTDYWADRT
jgi:hypothetical protein